MKGFVRILEAIIASIILIASLSYFFIPQAEKSEWDDTVLGIQARESLIALEKSGDLGTYVKGNDVSGLNAALKKTISPNIDFSVEVAGIPNPVIKVACWCTSLQAGDLENKVLHPATFSYKGRTIEIRIQTVADPNSIPPDTNMLFVFDYQNLNNYAAVLDNFLKNGGTIYMFADLTPGQANDGYLNTRLGLSWSGSGGGAGRFYDTTNPSRVSYKIAKYYQALRNEDPSTAVFNSFSSAAKINVEANRTIIVSSGNQISYIKINEFVLGRGRSVWSAKYDYNSNNPDTQQANNLTKATVMWASGERFRMDAFKKTPAPAFSEARYVSILDGDSYEISLIFWKVFY